MKECCIKENMKIIKEYESKPRNKDGTIRFFLYRWDDGKDGVRLLKQCRVCKCLYLVQAYRLNKFFDDKRLYEDYYTVKNEKEADFLNRTYTGVELEHKLVACLQRKR